MDIIQNLISEELIYALGWTVMHSLWQGFLIAIIMVFVLQLLKRKSASIRYEVATISLFLILVSAVCTFIWHYDSAGELMEQELVIYQSNATQDVVLATTGFNGFAQSCVEYFNQHLPLIVLLWLVGVAFFVLRLFGGLAYVQRLKYHQSTLLPPYWQNKVKALAAKIPTKKTAQIFESASVKVPMVIGYFKPFILLPIGAINQLGEDEIEAIVAHELAHVFRNDFLMNIVLSFIEVVFYYHPAVWWISGNIRLERENCCDDIAIKVCGNSLIYAKALVRLQELNAYVPGFAMPFSGQKNQLLNRIKRILNQPQSRSNIIEKLTATCFLFVAVIFMSVSANVPEQQRDVEVLIPDVEVEDDWDYQVVDVLIEQDTTPDGKKKLEHGVLEITVEHGDVVGAKLDGKVIPKEELEAYDVIKTEKEVIINRPDNSSANFFHFDPRSNRKNQQTITKDTNEEGQTIIIIEELNRDPVEIVVEEGVVIVEGSELEDGDQAIIIDETARPSRRLHFFNDKDEFHLLADSIAWNGTILSDKERDDWKARFTEKEILALELYKEQELLKEVEALEQIARFKGDKQKELEREQFFLHKKMQEKENDLFVEKQNQEAYEELIARNKEIEADQLRFFKEKEQHLFDLRNELRENSTAQRIASELKRDGLIKDVNNFSFLLSNKRLKVNNKKQAQAILKKYKRLYKELTGSELKNRSKYHINMSKD